MTFQIKCKIAWTLIYLGAVCAAIGLTGFAYLFYLGQKYGWLSEQVFAVQLPAMVLSFGGCGIGLFGAHLGSYLCQRRIEEIERKQSTPEGKP